MSKVVLGASIATAIGVTTVAYGANAIEKKSPPPPFSMKGDRFDLSTFQGRFFQQLRNCDPSSLLSSNDDIKKAQDLLNDFKSGKGGDNLSLWNARKLVESAVHPDTGEIIPHPFRMSGYVPFNGPVCVGMMASTGTAGILFWSWINQSQNALVNYFNRNASSETSNDTLAISYTGAVTAALGVALGLSTLIKRTMPPASAAKVMKFVAFPSSIIASCSNCYIMRSPEIDSGVNVLDKNGVTLAQGKKSSLAAKKAVYETVASRAILQVPVFFVPAVIMSLPPIAAVTTANPGLSIPLVTLITIMSFGFGLPAAVGYFPQIGEIDVNDLEEDIRSLVPEGIKTVYYNKGL